MESNLDFSLVASSVANQTDSAIAKFVDYGAALRNIGQQKGLVKSLEQ